MAGSTSKGIASESTGKLKVGIDIEHIERFRPLTRDHPFVKNNYTPDEIRYCFSDQKSASHLTGMFCAKEAFIKAYGKRLEMKTIEIVHAKDGAPSLKIRTAKGQNMPKPEFELSISHTDSIAIAIVVRK